MSDNINSMGCLGTCEWCGGYYQYLYPIPCKMCAVNTRCICETCFRSLPMDMLRKMPEVDCEVCLEQYRKFIGGMSEVEIPLNLIFWEKYKTTSSSSSSSYVNRFLKLLRLI